MTKEQEAIEICKKEIIEPFYDFPNPTSIELKDTDVEAIETVLSMIEKRDKQIDLMALAILNYDDQLVINRYKNIDEVKETFKDLAKEKGE